MKSCKVIFVLLGLALTMISVACDSVKKERKKPVRLQEPRIFPLPESQWNREQVRLLAPFKGEDGTILNVLATLGRHSELLDSYMKFIVYVASESTLPDRHREILMLRIGWLCQSKYEFGQHSRIAKEAGLTDDDIVRITEGPEDPGWSRFEATLIRAVDELYYNDIISDSTWNALSQRYNEKQLIDVIITVGQYNMVSWILNSLGVQLEKGVPGAPNGSK